MKPSDIIPAAAFLLFAVTVFAISFPIPRSQPPRPSAPITTDR